jgi:putative transposase
MRGKRHDLWRAVDQEGHVLDMLARPRRDKKAAKTCFRRRLKGGQYAPRVIIIDKLQRYGAAKRELLPSVAHRQHRYLNHRAENSHQPTRQRCAAPAYRPEMSQRVDTWREITSLPTAA